MARICELTGAHTARKGARIASLWSGYGEVFRVHLSGGPAPTVVVKQVRPPAAAHPRKLRSYEVEQAWYRDWSARCGDACRVPRCFGLWREGSGSGFVLEDLDAAGFSLRRHHLSRDQTDLCLRWLARFHGTFLGAQPAGLWPIGTYWHLATRKDELAAMRNTALRAQAPLFDAQLNTATFQTLVHGDAKPANFCFSADEHAVSAVDFQYVGGGCGIRDVAYLLGGHRAHHKQALATYFDALRRALPAHTDADAIEAEWRGLYDVASLDFERFLDGWR
jgi:aminoglycoside phosphotransferase (APT) family kinase protein